MLRHTFVPDYSVRAVTDVLYLAMKRTLYLAAKRATLMERSQKNEDLGSNEPIDEEVEKVNLGIIFIEIYSTSVQNDCRLNTTFDTCVTSNYLIYILFCSYYTP